MGNFNYFTIDKVLGLNLSQDVTNIVPGQLIKNDNYLYMANGGLQERGGGTVLVGDPGAGAKLNGFANYISNAGIEYLICVQGTKAYYYSAGWNDLSLTLTTNLRTRFEQAGFDTGRALYGCNGTDAVIKISGSAPTASLLTGTSPVCTYLKLHKNRLFGTDGKDTLYFTDALAFDTWALGTNDIAVFPGIDGYIKALEVWGDALFIFKEHGVYVLPNAADADPTSAWKILRTDAETGTQSPDTVKRTRLGIMYLGSDDKIRLTGPQVTFSSGEYTLGKTGSPSVCEAIWDDLNENLDRANKDKAVAVVHKDLYILSWQSNANASVYNDRTYFADTTKTIKLPNNPQPEPFWGCFTGFNYDWYAQQTVTGNIQLYGAKGTNGDVQETLNDTIHNDNASAIASHAILGYLPIGSEGTYSRITQVKFVGYTENWYIDLVFNTFTLGKNIPTDGEGISRQFSSNPEAASLVGTALVGTATASATNIASSVYHVGLRGNYFKAEFKNLNADQFTRVLKCMVYYRRIKQK